MDTNGTAMICFYCEQDESMEACTYMQPMYFVTERNQNFNKVSIKFNESKIPIARCSSCKEKHENKIPETVIWILSIISATYVRFTVDWPTEIGSQIVAYIICLIGIAVLFAILDWVWRVFFFTPIFKTKPEGRVKSHLDIIRMQDEGWSLTKPEPKSASVSKPKRKKY